MSAVLLVDDSEINLAVYRGALHGFDDVEREATTSPLDALRRMRTRHYDLVVVDHHMPQMTGLDFIREAREIDGSTLMIMITADGDVDVRRRALELGATDFLTKPIDRAEFIARVRNLLSLSVSRREIADRAERLHEEVQDATRLLREREIETIVRLTRAAEFRDSVTGLHVIRVGEMCAALARTIGLPEQECEELLLAAPMHDIGKVATPDHILLKPGRLTADEFEIMKEHAATGYAILDGSTSPMLKTAAVIALNHHERWDGTGYPNHLPGPEIPLVARLCAAIDVFDALTSVRPYKKAWNTDAAIAELDANAGTHFDPDVIAVFHDAATEIDDIRRRFSADPGAGTVHRAM